MRRGKLVSMTCVILLAGLAGCAGPRLVSYDRNSGVGVVAVPNNSNCWPYYYHDKAEALMARTCPAGYAIDNEGEAVTGSVSHTNGRTDTRGAPTLMVGGKEGSSDKKGNSSDLLAGIAVPLGKTEEKHEETTTVQNTTEWRITFRSAPQAAATR